MGLASLYFKRSLFFRFKTSLGQIPSFSWDSFSKELGTTLGISSLSLRADNLAWKETNTVSDEVKGPLLCFSLNIQAVEKCAYLLVNKDDLTALMCIVLKLDPASLNAIPQDFFTSFYQFAAAVAATCYNKQELGKKVPVHLAEEENIPSQPMLCQDIWVTCDERTFLYDLLFQKNSRNLFPPSQKLLSARKQIQSLT